MEASKPEIEAEWVRRAAEGEQDAFGRLVAEHQKALYAFLLGTVRRPETADDLVQETFLKAWKALPAFKGESAFRTWLFKIGLNAARSWGRRPRWLLFFSQREQDDEGPLPDPADPSPEADPEAGAERADRRERILKLLDRLSPREREVTVLKHVEDMTIAQIASVTGMAEGTVKVHLFRAVQKMRSWMEDEDERSGV
jgi:RNA polymerase sigma-70 factor (ECF subfamily)